MPDYLSTNENIKGEVDLPKCNAKEIVKGELVECLESKPLCEHYFHFGDGLYCKHPLKLEIAKRTREEKKRENNSSVFTKVKK